MKLISYSSWVEGKPSGQSPWTPNGALVMAMWLNDFMEDDAEFDASIVSVMFKQYASIIEWACEYFDDYRKFFAIREADNQEFINELLIDWIGKRTIVIEFDGGIIIKDIEQELENQKDKKK